VHSTCRTGEGWIPAGNGAATLGVDAWRESECRMDSNSYDGQTLPHGLQTSAPMPVLDRNTVGNELMDALLFALPVHVAVLDRDGRIVAVNEAWKRSASDDAASAIARSGVGMNFLAVYRKAAGPNRKDTAQVEASIRAVLDGTQPISSIEYPVDSLTGRRWFLLEVSSLPGNLPGALVAHVDVTERKQTQEESAIPSPINQVPDAVCMSGRNETAPLDVQPTPIFRLRALEALTDTALSQLPIEDLMSELLERAMAVMRVDNAAILLLEEDGKTLSLRAARGPEEELVDAVTVSMGEGFAGGIAASRKPMVLDDVAALQIATPLLHEKLRSLVGVPLLVGDRLVGVVQVGSATARHFTQQDVDLLLLVADRIGPAVERARLYAAAQEARARAEAALAHATASEAQATERAEELQTILETMADGVAVFDQAGHITQTNRAFRELLALDRMPGFETSQAGVPWSVLGACDSGGRPIPPEHFAVFKALRGEVVSGAGTDMRVRTADGRELEMTATAAPLRDGKGHITGAVVVTRDVSWRRRLEREREEARANELALKETSQRLDEFLATAAHDLRAPLAVTTTAIDLAASRIERLVTSVAAESPNLQQRIGGMRDLLDEASQSVDRLSRMVTMLFDTAQLRAGTLELHRRRCDLGTLVREQVDALRRAHPRRTIRVETPGGVPLKVTADVDRISQVISNYVTNALKYSPEDQPVNVRVTSEGVLVRVSVSDRGPGLPRGEQERIWQRFYRVRGIQVQGKQSIGLGLGLHISKTIVERHGGQVGLESAVGVGSTFWFTLPANERHA
jgi:signal transduction histidine kinase/GAF domain-containing protein